MVDAVTAGNASGALTTGEAIERILPLFGREGVGTAERLSLGFGNTASFGNSINDTAAFIHSDGREHCRPSIACLRFPRRRRSIHQSIL